jgi:GDPmannose 4,6-dehydratase
VKTALITGINGQDGAYLAELLLENGYNVVGAERRNTGLSHWRTDQLGITQEIEYVDFELLEPSNIQKVMLKVRPDEIYNLAAQSFVGLSFEQPTYTCDVNFMGVCRILEGMDQDAKLYQASTSEMFGSTCPPQNESSPFYPRSPYGVAKLAAYWMCVNYREAYDYFICNGFLFNHESPLRGEEFVTRKVVKHLTEVKQGKRDYVELGNLDAKRDWGHAKDYVKAMHLIMQEDKPDDYVVATGETHTVREFVSLVCDKLDLEFEKVVKYDKGLERPTEVDALMGDPAKIKSLGWVPMFDFDSLIDDMINKEAA